MVAASRKAKKPRVLIVKMSSMGDLFHALPTVHCLKEGLDAEIHWVTQTEYVSLVQCFTDVSRVIGFPRRRFLKSFLPFMSELRRDRYDYVIDLQGLLKSALVTKGARGKKKIGPSYSREGSHKFYDDVAGPLNRDRHAVDQALDVVRYLGLEVLDPVFSVDLPWQNVDVKPTRVAFVPCSRWDTKNWPVRRFIEVGRALHQEAAATLFLVGTGPDRHACREIEEGLSGAVVNASGRTSLVDLGSLLQEMDLVISVDSGPMHMAAAVGTPVLAIFGPTDPRRTGPYGKMHRVVTAERTACWPCRSRNCPDCLSAMRRLSADTVITTALEMLKDKIEG